MRATVKVPADELRLIADRYRRATFDLLTAARTLRDTAELLAATRVKVAPTAVTDLTEAWGILRELPTVKVGSGTVRHG